MKDFETWYKELISDTMWYELLRHYKDETIKKAGGKVFAQLAADETIRYRPVGENRKHVYNILCKNPGDKVIKQEWIEKALKKIEPEKKEEWKPVSWDKRAEYLKMVQAEIDKIDNKKIRPLLDGEAEVNGQYDLPKPKAKCAPSAPVDVVLEHINKVKEARRKFYRDRNPNATDEEVQAYIDKFDTI